MVLVAPTAKASGTCHELNRPPLRWFARPMTMVVGLLLFYSLVSLAMDPGGYLSTDTGGKTATVAGMSERGDWSPEIGYWAESWDPEGELHPYWGTARRGDIWVNVTSLPMILAARPLWDVGGERAVLMIPMLGSVFAALAAGRLSQRFGASRAWPTVLLVGLASPAAVYALDFWEHSLGLALMAWGFVWVLDAIGADASGNRLSANKAIAVAGIAGLSFGFAANLRQEALIYGLVAGLYLAANLYSKDRRLKNWLAPASAMAGGALAMLSANMLLERLVFGESPRLARSAGSLANAGSSGVWFRLTEAAVTFSSPVDTVHWTAIVLASLVAVGLVWTTIGHVRKTEMRRPLALVALSILVVVLRLVTFGPSFISGLLAAAPLAGAGIGLAWLKKRRTPLVLALAPLPLVWYFQYPGAAAPQWGGRYVLVTGLLLTAYAMGQWESYGEVFTRWSRALVVASGVITMIGLAFLSERSHGFAIGSAALADRVEDVVIFDDPFLPREAGTLGVGERWLAATDLEARSAASAVVTAAGFDTFAFVSDHENLVEFDHFVVVERSSLVFLADTKIVFVTSYERVP
jgi:hypothetical protein